MAIYFLCHRPARSARARRVSCLDENVAPAAAALHLHAEPSTRCQSQHGQPDHLPLFIEYAPRKPGSTFSFLSRRENIALIARAGRRRLLGPEHVHWGRDGHIPILQLQRSPYRCSVLRHLLPSFYRICLVSCLAHFSPRNAAI